MGPDLPATDRAACLAAAAPTLMIEPARPDFPGLLRRCRLSISQAGYNTVMDVLNAGCASVLVPFAQGGEGEQTIRASLLAQRGLATVVAEPDLTPHSLIQAISDALNLKSAPMTLDFGGAAATAAFLVHAAQRRMGRSRA